MSASNTRRNGPADGEARGAGGLRPMHISLRANERLFLNGAVVRVDRKVTLELLNDATFLLENHVLQVEDTTTPLRQLYFAVQAMLMDPQNAQASQRLFEAMAADVKTALSSDRLAGGIDEAMAQVAGGRPFHALKTLRGLFAEEAALLGAAAERPRPVAPPATDPAPCARDRVRANANGPSEADRPPETGSPPRPAPVPQSLQ
jgi:flagellar protein FlbT